MVKTLTLFFALLITISQVSAQEIQEIVLEEAFNHCPPCDQSELSVFYPAKQPQSVIIITHGLNLRPSKMNEFIQALKSTGHSILRVALLGHRGDAQEFSQVTYESLISHYKEQLHFASESAKKLNIPLNALNFSLGSAIHLDALNSTSIALNKQVLLAPAIWPRWYANLFSLINFLPNDWALPSQNHEDYRSQDSTPLAAYFALSEVREKFNSKAVASTIETLVFIDPDDELISEEKIKKFMSTNTFDRWSLIEVQKKNAQLEPNYHHLIIDKATLGHESWTKMLAQIQNFFAEKAE